MKIYIVRTITGCDSPHCENWNSIGHFATETEAKKCVATWIQSRSEALNLYAEKYQANEYADKEKKSLRNQIQINTITIGA